MCERCGECKWFDPEGGNPQVDRKIIQILDLDIFKSPARDGGSRPPTYGKCKAQFTNEDGDEEAFDSGTFSNCDCNARDDRGKILFSKKGASIT